MEEDLLNALLVREELQGQDIVGIGVYCADLSPGRQGMELGQGA